ncbi:cardiolipin synthase [Catenisphaera adipataccumulans]|uniref:Cardiolipin synthase n=1 Tax=Catenisphaera adipataccumulans TaxID=700500 RepID=A0A7W8CW05_9FIRM|nr:cardiolipin synthase [Catenisphaera adipataccumulans]MBB5182341.1 cardiolipin synthase [Catenisphaera adipataccumulans]
MERVRVEQKTSVRNSVLRLVLVAIAIVLQVTYIINFFNAFVYHTTEVQLAITFFSALVALWIYGKDANSQFKMPWIILIMAFPIVGLVMYALMGRANSNHRMRVRYEKIDARLDPMYHQDPDVLTQMEQEDIAAANQSRLIWEQGGYPVYQNTQMEYYDNAADGFEAQKQALRKAEHFIFMEYHAIEDKESFAGMKSILYEKAAQGVEVRILYDDVGSIGFLNRQFIKEMEEHGIQCRDFNPVMPLLLVFMNNRDHRKITVIDGKVGFTGGYNLANEYFNITHPYGYWKDTGVRLIGDAVNSLTLTFLQMWNAVKDTDVNEEQYLVKSEQVGSDGYIQPYADMPLDNLNLAEDVYMNIINNAKHYVYFVTPYLVITDELTRILCLAAARGVDVRIVTPGIPDKKITYMMTRSYYRQLVKHGVKIYEYTPGFCHVKMCVSDDEAATCGSINLDFRSLYLHFENGVFMYKNHVVQDIKADFENMFEESRDVSEKYRQPVNVLVRTWWAILRLISPMF